MGIEPIAAALSELRDHPDAHSHHLIIFFIALRSALTSLFVLRLSRLRAEALVIPQALQCL